VHHATVYVGCIFCGHLNSASQVSTVCRYKWQASPMGTRPGGAAGHTAMLPAAAGKTDVLGSTLWTTSATRFTTCRLG
jgi:hypothetical protein